MPRCAAWGEAGSINSYWVENKSHYHLKVGFLERPSNNISSMIFPFFYSGTHFSTLIRNGKLLLQRDPLDCESPWVSDDGTETMSSDLVAAEMSSVGAELAVLQISELLRLRYFNSTICPGVNLIKLFWSKFYTSIKFRLEFPVSLLE